MPWTVYNSDGQILQGSSTLADDAVTTAKILNLAVTNAKLADDAVDSDEIAAGAIDLAHMSVNSIDSDQYVDGSIDLAHMSANSVDSAQYVDGSIDTAHIANLQITNALVADDAIGVAELSATGTASSSVFLRGDNAWVAPGGGPSQATQSALEAATNEDTYAPPDLINYHPGVAKAWACFEMLGTHDFNGTANYNFASISDRAQGKSDLVIATDFSSQYYSAQISSDAYMQAYGSGVANAAGTINVINTDTGGTPQDTGNYSIALFGDQ